jgi:glutamate decarboxylase
MGANAQVALEYVKSDDVSNGRKFARYFDVEARIIPVSKESNYCLDVNKIRENLDENTIGNNW